MRDSWRHFVAEFVGTFGFVFVGGASIMIAKDSGSPAGLLGIALAHGLMMAAMVSALMRISGHFNPAITLGFLATRRISASMAGVYIFAQLIGAILASYALKFTFPFTLVRAYAWRWSIARAAGFGQSGIRPGIHSYIFPGARRIRHGSRSKSATNRRTGNRDCHSCRYARDRSAHGWFDEPGAIVRASGRKRDL